MPERVNLVKPGGEFISISYKGVEGGLKKPFYLVILSLSRENTAILLTIMLSAALAPFCQ